MDEQSSGIGETLEERGKRYGEFRDHARISQGIKFAMTSSSNWNYLRSYQQEALEMIAHKMARILNGDADYKDSWHDIAGYATLVENILK